MIYAIKIRQLGQNSAIMDLKVTLQAYFLNPCNLFCGQRGVLHPSNSLHNQGVTSAGKITMHDNIKT